MKFYPDYCLLQNLHTGMVKGTSKVVNALYYWDHDPRQQMKYSVALSTVDMNSLWHQRLGHIPHKVLQQMHVINHNSMSNTKLCPICPLAKKNPTFISSKNH